MNRTSINCLPTFTIKPVKASSFDQPLFDLCQGHISISVMRQVQQADFGYQALHPRR